MLVRDRRPKIRALGAYRLDHALVSPVLFPQLRDVRYSHAERETGVSDHSSLILELADT